MTARIGPTLAALVLLPAVSAAAPTGREYTNDALAGLWAQEALPRLRTAATQALQAQVGRRSGSGRNSIEVTRVRRVDLRMAAAPGFARMDPTRIELALPLQGRWNLELEVDARIRARAGFIRLNKRVRIKARVRNLRARARIDIDASDPTKPVIQQVQRPQVDFDLRLSTNKWYLNVFLFLLRPVIDRTVRRLVDDAIARLDPSLAGLAGRPQPFGAGGPGVAAAAPNRVTFAQAAAGIDAGIQAHHLPFGSLLSVRFDTPYTGTWEDSLADPNFSPGNPTGYSKYKDSSIWTGHYLASLAYRYAVTGDAAALNEAARLVQSFDTMLRMRGTPGLLNRALRPQAQDPATIRPGGEEYLVTHNGEQYVAWDFVSRDAYMGMLFGLSLAHDLIPDPRVRDRARVALELAIDRLLADGWSVKKRDGSISTTWAVESSQQLAYLHVGNRIDPQKYAAELARGAGLADVVWIGPWSTTLDPVRKYYKFNLAHGVLHLIYRLETDPGRYLSELRAIRILRAQLGAHQNPHFDAIAAQADPSLAATLRPEVTNLLRQFLRRPRRQVTIDNTHDPTIQKTQYVPPSAGVSSGVPASMTVAKYPIPVTKRQTNEFLWQRSPFRLDTQGDGRTQHPGMDFLLPYWMGRAVGVLP